MKNDLSKNELKKQGVKKYPTLDHIRINIGRWEYLILW
jgi:hypothetical protein